MHKQAWDRDPGWGVPVRAHLGPRPSCCGAVLCITGCLAASLASIRDRTVAPQPLVVTTENVIRLCQASPKGKSPWSAAHLGCPSPNPSVRGHHLPAREPHPQGF